MWSDKESKIDFLNFNETAESIKDLITEKELMPISIGVFGDWGAGKSTILELTKASLETDEQEYIQVHFDAWTFQGYDDAKAALLETIASTLVKKAADDKNLSAKAIEFAGRIDKIRLMGLLMDGGAALAGIPTMGGIQKIMGLFSGGDDGELDVDDVKGAVDGAKDVAKKNKGLIKDKKSFSPPKEIKEFRKAYSDLLKEFDKPLIVYVDNLDRCSPFNAISTLEAIRLFLFLPNTAFVIAADEDMIRLAVPEYHKGASQRHQTDYLDKLIQIPVHVPRPGVLEIRAYLMMLTAQDHGVTDAQLEAIRCALEESLRLSWKQPQITVDELLQDHDIEKHSGLRSKFVVAEQLAPLLAESTNINGNPRIVKRLLNQVKMRKKTAHRRGMQLDEKTITKLVIFERCLGTQATNKLYELIDKENGYPKVLADLENSEVEFDEIKLPEEWKLDLAFIDKWSKLPPMFTEMDLTPAAYLSRESIPMGAVNAVMSGAAQKLVEELMKQKVRVSGVNSTAITTTPKEEYMSVMDGLIENFKLIGDWTEKPTGIYGAVLLAKQDDKCCLSLLTFLKSLPRQRWLNPILKELEGIK
ncbi:ATPase [Pseudoalteromonas ruthenica]|jgi:predicted KAP-like P-loop ATPase|uniref:ATPase n=3 Tax=Pseudoalteromonas TaxID=53246 RepID=A0A5S3Z5Q5_9GAMM|nr:MULTISPECIES: P-loop NTPase fold protein [Pseudoalteromonas]MEC8325416.1 P-loop NTPase fold protein [Pseudomonadota bacterium]AXV66192.1 ATPase [Pseudoalteromonas donghaensis]MCF2862308.1 ATPase [Pseudoalteromonas sp. CNAT2-18]MCG7557923.1 P-loop NTPase fold protein [Pseudoalteromonas sp. CNAT2-18.1]MCG7570131.1 P-loop NTPase fold protein [Pseudoalteromonas sp. CNC9-20]